MIRNGEKIFDFVVVILILRQQSGKGDDEMLRQLVTVVVDSLLLFGRENLTSGTATDGCLPRSCLLDGAAPEIESLHLRKIQHLGP